VFANWRLTCAALREPSIGSYTVACHIGVRMADGD
jgi:hypothetical protein